MRQPKVERNMTIVEDSVVFIEETEAILKKEDLEEMLSSIRRRKLRIKEQNTQLIKEFNELTLEEDELIQVINQLGNIDLEEI